jgi:hypothetical protein
MKKIGFLSFGHWTPSSQSQTRSAADTLLQSIDLAVAAEELGGDGAYFRVHHFARQLASPFPLVAAVGAKTSRIEIGTAVIDMRYESPFYKGVAMLGDKSLDCKRRLPSDRFNEFVGSGEYSVGMVDGDLPQVLHQELAARRARNPIGLRIERPRVITRRPSRRGAGHHLRPLLDRHGLVGDFAAEHSANEFGNLIVRQLDHCVSVGFAIPLCRQQYRKRLKEGRIRAGFPE